MTILTVGVDILDGSFEVDFSYTVLPPREGEGSTLIRYEARFRKLRRAGHRLAYLVPFWMRPLVEAWLQNSGDVYLAIARAEGKDVS